MSTNGTPNIFVEWNARDETFDHKSCAHSTQTSTTVNLGSSFYCIHCGDIAKIVQFNDRCGRRESYIDVGHRCMCSDAIHEIHARMAYCKLNDKFDGYGLTKEVSAIIISNHTKELIHALYYGELPTMSIVDGSGSWCDFETDMTSYTRTYSTDYQDVINNVYNIISEYLDAQQQSINKKRDNSLTMLKCES